MAIEPSVHVVLVKSNPEKLKIPYAFVKSADSKLAPENDGNGPNPAS